VGAEERERFAAGELVVLRAHLPGTTACAAFHPERYVHQTLARDLAVIDLVPGGTMESLRQDTLLLRKPWPSRFPT